MAHAYCRSICRDMCSVNVKVRVDEAEAKEWPRQSQVLRFQSRIDSEGEPRHHMDNSQEINAYSILMR